jgi:hypothetical protein
MKKQIISSPPRVIKKRKPKAERRAELNRRFGVYWQAMVGFETEN